MLRCSYVLLLFLAMSVILTGCKALKLKEVRGDLPIERKTRLMLAAGTGDLYAVEQALALGENVNAKSEELWTPLHFAAVSGSGKVVELLLEHGADINAMDDYLITPLHAGVMQGWTSVVRVLAQHGADLDIRDGQGDTPMHVAARMGMDDLVSLLAGHGATVHPGGSDPLDVWATAVQYRAVGREQSRRSEGTAALESYRQSAEHFQKASEGCQAAAKTLRSRAFRTRFSGWVAVTLLVFVDGASAANAHYQARMQAYQMAQYDALAKAARGQPGPGHGTGVAIYTQHNIFAGIDTFQRKASLLDEMATRYEKRAKKSAAYAADCRRKEGCP